MVCNSPRLVAESTRRENEFRFSAAAFTVLSPVCTSLLMRSRFFDCAFTVRARSPESNAKLRIDSRNSLAALSSNATCTRSATLATSPEIRPATDVSCAISGSMAPANVSPEVRASASAARSSRSGGTPAYSLTVACHSPNRLDATSSTTGSDGNGMDLSMPSVSTTHPRSPKAMPCT